MFPLKVFQKHLMSYGKGVKAVYVILEFGVVQHTCWYKIQRNWNIVQNYAFFIGYPKESRGGLFYDPQENKIPHQGSSTS